MARIKLKERTLENDIKYGGILSYRHLRIIGWLLLAIAQISTILTLEAKLNKDTAQTVEIWITILQYAAVLPLPLFFLANFSHMNRKRADFKSMLLFYGGAAIGMYVFCNFLVLYYGHGVFRALNPDVTRSETLELFGQILPVVGSGYNLNMFIDMFLFTLLFFFIFYKPKKFFTGKKIIIFRLFALLPILYDLGAIFVKYYIYQGYFTLKSQYFFLLPCKPPLVFGAFVIILLLLKFEEYRFVKKHDNNYALWEEHSKTNAHSLRMSIKMAVVFIIFAVTDFIVIAIFTFKIAADGANLYTDEYELIAFIMEKEQAVISAGIGTSTSLVFVVPIVLLFSYSKTHANPKLDVVVPALGIALIFFVYFEGIFEVLTRNLEAVMRKVNEVDPSEEALFLGMYYKPNIIFSSISRYIPGNYLSFASRC